jgi:hypothetical protein
VENQTSKKIKILRFENEGEYTSKDFDAFYKEVGIKREIFPCNSQQNGVTKKKN